jgi:3-hydroxybutyrate dehydrogenase
MTGAQKGNIYINESPDMGNATLWNLPLQSQVPGPTSHQLWGRQAHSRRGETMLPTMNSFMHSLAPPEARLGIRLAAVAPGAVKTLMCTEHAEKMKAIGSNDAWVTPEEAAEVVVALVDEDEVENIAGDLDKGEKIFIRRGSILEVCKERVGDVPAFNDPGPTVRPENTTSRMRQLEDEFGNALCTNWWGIR